MPLGRMKVRWWWWLKSWESWELGAVECRTNTSMLDGSMGRKPTMRTRREIKCKCRGCGMDTKGHRSQDSASSSQDSVSLDALEREAHKPNEK